MTIVTALQTICSQSLWQICEIALLEVLC